MKRHTNLILGFTFTGIGILGAFLPVLPSTCFFITAAYFFSQSSKRMESWLLNHRLFGPSIVQWRRDRAIPLFAKIVASASMILSGAIISLSPTNIAVQVSGIIVLAICFWYVNSRPTARRR